MTSYPKASEAIKAALGGNEPSEEQWAAIAHPPQPLAVVAGAGTGKTAVMAARIVWMVQEMGLSPSQILGLTFTNLAAGALEERVQNSLSLLDPPPVEAPEIATYNSFADRLVRAHGVRIGIDPEAGLLSAAQRWQLTARALDRCPPFEYSDWVSVAWFTQMALGLADACANHDVSPGDVIRKDQWMLDQTQEMDKKVVAASRKRMELMTLVSEYVDIKQEGGWIDFGDQMTKAVEIVETSSGLVADLIERYPMILLDEYQDTNVVQRKLMQKLAPAGHNITAVGDARQNVYEWRGSTIFNLLDFPKKHFLREGGKPYDFVSLSKNFRSGSKILSVANKLIEGVDESRRPGKDLQPVADNGEGSVKTALFADELAEAEFIASEIESLHGTKLPRVGEATWNEFAILVRRKAHIPRLYDALTARDIPVEVIGLGGLLRVPEVMDAVAWLRVMADPGPEANRWLARILLGPRFRIHYRDLAVLARWAAGHTKELSANKRGPEVDDALVDETQFEPEEVAYSLLDALEHLKEIEGLDQETNSRLEMAFGDVKAMRRLSAGSLLELVKSVIDFTGISEELASSPKQSAPAAERNITKFLGMVADFRPVSGEPSLPALLAFLDAAEEAEEAFEPPTPTKDDSVKLMTIHQAKGLEFGVVFVPGVAATTNAKGEKVNSIFPSQIVTDPARSYGVLPHGVREDRDHLPSPWESALNGKQTLKKMGKYRKELIDRAIEEERRLFYVALTRAKQVLYVTAAFYYDRNSTARGPSQFFEEVVDCSESESVLTEEAPDVNPVIQRLRAESSWPPSPEHRLRFEEPFLEGYPDAVEKLLDGAITPEELLDRLDSSGQTAATEHLQHHLQVLEGLSAAAIDDSSQPDLESLSATNAAAIASGGLETSAVIRPLPQRPSAARRIGTLIHQWIEEQARGLMGVADDEELSEPSEYLEPSRIEGLKQEFRKEWAQRTYARLPGTSEPMAELPFVLKVGERIIRGRIDAVYESQDGDGGLEIVDFKTGAKIESTSTDQLDVYAAALVSLGVEFKGPLKITYCYLAQGESVSRIVSAEEASGVLERLARQLDERVGS